MFLSIYDDVIHNGCSACEELNDKEAPILLNSVSVPSAECKQTVRGVLSRIHAGAGRHC